MITKFCSDRLISSPWMMAKVMVVVAMMIAACLSINSLVLKRLGNRNRKNSWLSTMAMTT